MGNTMNNIELCQSMFNRMNKEDKIKILEYVASNKHEIIIDEVLR